MKQNFKSLHPLEYPNFEIENKPVTPFMQNERNIVNLQGTMSRHCK